MADGSEEAQVVGIESLSDLAAVEVLNELSAGGELDAVPTDEGEPDATEATATEAGEVSAPEAEKPPEGAKTAEPSDTDLQHLPEDLREALRDQPVEVQEAQDKAFKSFQGSYNRKVNELKEREDALHAEVGKDEELRRFGEAFRQILSNDETADEAIALARRVREADDSEVGSDDLDGILDAPDDATMKERLGRAIDSRVEAKFQADQAPARAQGEMVEALRGVVKAQGLTPEQQPAFLETLAELESEAAEAGFEVTPQNVSAYLRPRLQLKIATAPKPAAQKAKPEVIKGRKAAGVPRDSNATTHRRSNLERIAAENRQLEDADVEALLEDVRDELGMPSDELNKVLRSGR